MKFRRRKQLFDGLHIAQRAPGEIDFAAFIEMPRCLRDTFLREPLGFAFRFRPHHRRRMRQLRIGRKNTVLHENVYAIDEQIMIFVMQEVVRMAIHISSNFSKTIKKPPGTVFT